jgi:hypothetical protein
MKTLKRIGAQHLRKRSQKRFGRNECPKKNRGSALAEVKLKMFQKKRVPKNDRGSAFMEAKLKTFWKKRRP